LIWAIILGSAVLFFNPVWAAHDKTAFDSVSKYDIYYEVSNFEVDKVENVQILGVTAVGNQKFLVITHSGIIKDKESYILLSTVKAILVSSINPKRTYDTSN